MASAEGLERVRRSYTEDIQDLLFLATHCLKESPRISIISKPWCDMLEWAEGEALLEDSECGGCQRRSVSRNPTSPIDKLFQLLQLATSG